MSFQTPNRNRRVEGSSEDPSISGSIKNMSNCSEKYSRSLSSKSPLLANRPIYSTPQPLNASSTQTLCTTPVKQNFASPPYQGNIMNSEPKLDSSRALMQRVENVLKRSQSLANGSQGKSEETRKYEVQSPVFKNHLSIGSFTPSYNCSDFIKLKASTTTAKDFRDTWKQSHDEKINDLKSTGEAIKSIYEDVLRNGRRHSRNYSENNISFLQSSIQDSINKKSSPAVQEDGVKGREQGWSEINALRSGINSIEGQLNALETLNASSLMSKIFISSTPSAGRSQSCISRKGSALEKEEPINYASISSLKDHKPSFFETTSRKGSSIPISSVDLSNKKQNSSFVSNKTEAYSDLSVNNVISLIQHNFESPSIAKSQLNSRQSQFSNNSTRSTRSSNVPVRAIYEPVTFGNIEKDSPNLIDASLQRPSPHYSANLQEMPPKRQKMMGSVRRDLTETDYTYRATEEVRLNTLEPEHTLQASILNNSYTPNRKEQGLRNYQITYSSEKRDVEATKKSQPKENNASSSIYQRSLNANEQSLDLGFASSGDKKMKKLTLRPRSIEEIEKKEPTGLVKISSQPKDQSGDTTKEKNQLEDKKKTQDTKPSSQVTFRPLDLGLNSSILRNAQNMSKEITDDGRAWRMKKLPNALFEDAEQPFDFGSEAPRMTPPAKSREKVAARLPHSRSYSGCQNMSKTKISIWPQESSNSNIITTRTNFVNKPRLSENPKKKPVIPDFFKKE